MRQKGIVLLPLLIIVVLIGAVGYLFYQNLQLRKKDLLIEIRPTPISTIEADPTIIASPKVQLTPTSIIEKAKCHENEKYFVVIKPKSRDYLIKYKNSDNETYECIYDKGVTDFEIINRGWDWYMQLENDFLLIDSGTGPPPRGFTVYDLEKRLKVYSGSYNLPVDVKNNYFEYWKELPTIKVTDENCPDKDYWEGAGLGTAIEERVRLDLTNLEETSLNELRCSGRQ
jgi:hypothetical protein